MSDAQTDVSAVTVDRSYDRRNADTGTGSRYANYIRMNLHQFTQISFDEPAAEFAATAWRIGTGPIMVPGFVDFHPRIAGAAVNRSHWNGELVADIELVAPRPESLRWIDTSTGVYISDWMEGWGGTFEYPGEDDIAARAYLTTTVRMQWQLPNSILPEIAYGPDGIFSDAQWIVRTAVACIDGIVTALNREINPIIDRIEGRR